MVRWRLRNIFSIFVDFLRFFCYEMLQNSDLFGGNFNWYIRSSCCKMRHFSNFQPMCDSCFDDLTWRLFRSTDSTPQNPLCLSFCTDWFAFLHIAELLYPQPSCWDGLRSFSLNHLPKGGGWFIPPVKWTEGGWKTIC